ncbi:type IV secretory system conjugative DNA transfer family protein [Bradyrhizobium sp. RT5a]|uniref:type IV secretory system conjugative DNA transfer family protein n=1 Tax=Bradyrhizobium sp. RT5a TaxID=3156380 RepID=UPI003391FF5B
MHYARLILAATIAIGSLILGYPAAYIVQHGWNSSAWPGNAGITPLAWLQELSVSIGGHYPNLVLVALTYSSMWSGHAPAFADGGVLAAELMLAFTLSICTLIILGGRTASLRVPFGQYGNAKWASTKVIASLDKGIEIGISPSSGRPVRIQVEGNLLTIAPPRSGKTGGFIIPNLVFPDANAWAGPAVVVDPKGDVYRAVRRRREAMGRVVRCIDPLGLVGGTDRWNPLVRTDPNDILYLQSMAASLLPAAKDTGDGNYFQSRANDIIVAAILSTVRKGRADPVDAAALLMRPTELVKALERHLDHSSLAAAEILAMEPKSRESIVSTAQQATQWLRDARMQQVVQDHTFEMSDLASGDVDLFIVLPADDRKKILAPYVRWLLSDLFASVRTNKPAERIIAFVDEAFVLGRFDAILDGVGELPGYGLSLWTFWQTRSQLVSTYSEDGAGTMISTAEMINVFNVSAADPNEKEYWSKAIGEYTGIKVTTTPDAKTGKAVETKTAEATRLVPASDLPGLLQRHQVVFLTGASQPPDPLKLSRTAAYKERRFEGLVELQTPVGKSS